MPHYVTFVVRIFLDKHDQVVEGQVTHVTSQKSSYFRDLSKVMTFIKQHLTSDPEPEVEDELNRTKLMLEGEDCGPDRD